MTTEHTIPLNLLVQSNANVRRTGRGEGIEELVASIAAHGLRQNLNVRPMPDGRYEVIAGARRLRALKQLAKAKALAKDMPIPCLVLGEAEDAAEISLAENVVRIAMHPADQFTAFHDLVVTKGLSVEQVATRFGVAPALVEKRLRLATVSPKLFALYRKGDLTLEQMMAFTVTDDHAAQERVWKERHQCGSSPHAIRRALTQGSVATTHRLARFVGVDAYVAAGGAVLRDLFDEDNEGYLTDGALLLQLATDRLETLLQPVRDEGWKWVKAELENDYTPYQHVYPVRAETAEDGEESGDAPEHYAPEDMARAGAVLRIAHDGSIDVQRGLVHPDDRKRETKAKAGKPDPATGALPASLVADLTAHRTAALRIELARKPAVALAATVHALCLSQQGPGSCLALRASSEALDRHAKVTDDSAAHRAMQDEAQRWAAILPEDSEALFAWCLTQPQETLLSLLAFLAAQSVNAVQSPHDHAEAPRLAHADRLADALALDMTQHWTPSVDGFYGRLPKAALIHLVRDADAPIQVSISSLKQKEAARYVQRAVAGRGWLPAPLRPALSA